MSYNPPVSSLDSKIVCLSPGCPLRDNTLSRWSITTISTIPRVVTITPCDVDQTCKGYKTNQHFIITMSGFLRYHWTLCSSRNCFEGMNYFFSHIGMINQITIINLFNVWSQVIIISRLTWSLFKLLIFVIYVNQELS